MKFIRWYDKYPEFKTILMLLENLNNKHIDFIANDFLQLIIKRYSSVFDKKLVQINKNAPKNYKRWYDKNQNLHTCIELVKTLDEKERQEAINLFIVSIASFIRNVDKQ